MNEESNNCQNYVRTQAFLLLKNGDLTLWIQINI